MNTRTLTPELARIAQRLDTLAWAITQDADMLRLNEDDRVLQVRKNLYAEAEAIKTYAVQIRAGQA
jgi:hypothetical protein